MQAKAASAETRTQSCAVRAYPNERRENKNMIEYEMENHVIKLLSE